MLAISGAQSEAHLPFAGLHQLLQPLLGQLDALPSPQRAALEAAFGLSDTDAHWLDRPTCDVLAFVARRVHFEPVVLVLAVRDGIDNPFETAWAPGACDPAA